MEANSTNGAVATRDDARANPRARQRALAIGIVDGRSEGEALAELKELLRTAGVATAGEMTQQRAAARSRPLLRPGQARPS